MICKDCKHLLRLRKFTRVPKFGQNFEILTRFQKFVQIPKICKDSNSLPRFQQSAHIPRICQDFNNLSEFIISSMFPSVFQDSNSLPRFQEFAKILTKKIYFPSWIPFYVEMLKSVPNVDIIFFSLASLITYISHYKFCLKRICSCVDKRKTSADRFFKFKRNVFPSHLTFFPEVY